MATKIGSVRPLDYWVRQKSKNTTSHKIIRTLKAKYKENANIEYGEAIKKYMRNQFEFFGIKAPLRRSIDKEVMKNFGKATLSVATVREILSLAWAEERRELQMFAVDFAVKHRQLLCGDSFSECEESLECIKTLITTKSWWDTVDMLASRVVGYFVVEHKELSKTMDEWIDNESMWIRRTAILHTLSSNITTDESQLYRYCLQRAHEEEFFIRKAIGWALRTHARHHPQSVKAFVKSHEDTLSALSKREALKHL